MWALDGAGDLLPEVGRVAAGMKVYELVTRLSPDASGAWVGLGEAYEAAGREREAVRAYERAAELEPDDEGEAEALERLRKTV